MMSFVVPLFVVSFAVASMGCDNCTCEMGLKTIGCIHGQEELIAGSRIFVQTNNNTVTLCKDDCGCFYANGQLQANAKNIVSGCFKLCPLNLLNSNACVSILSSPTFCVTKLNGTCPAK
ncbi:hypothetical protein niasHT_002927 [Heterodera trifolii]|uniref:Uncharacterized protein n=1 Tax=Heterodera trifolii TaxID=157864 RepID=A0ABD2LPE4_9BILA